jgi:CubicO group peptidase (beta-lactamase class C family)
MTRLHPILRALPALLVATALIAQTPAGTAAPVRNAAEIEHSLRRGGRVVGEVDSTFEITDRMKYWHVPGVSLAIIDNFRIVYAKGFGVTEFGGTTPVDTTTLFQAGSISKPIFASGALRLVEQGKLSLDEDVNAKLKSWRVPDSKFTEKEKVTLRRLLSHTAGLTVWGFPGYDASVAVPTVPQVLDGAPPANTAAVRNDTTPGARWLYSGGGFTIAQLLATDVTTEPFPKLLERLVLEPAGMSHSTYANPLPAPYSAKAASGHERVDTPVPGRFHTYPEMAAAGLWTTASDLARWELAITRSYNGDRNGILSPETALQMVSPQARPGQQFGGGAYGFGVAVENDAVADSIALSHGGRDEGFVAQIRMWPKLGRGYAILTNGVSGPFMGELQRALNEMYFTAPPRPEITPIAVDSTALAPLAGRYVSVQRTDTLRFDVAAKGNVLSMYTHLGKRTFRLWPVAKDAFRDVNNGAALLFERDSSGVVNAIKLGLAANASRAVRQ